MEDFRIRAYAKQELAMMYSPTSASPHAAVNRLMEWIKRSPALVEELESLGYRKVAKILTPAQVRAIVDYLGEP